MPKSARAQRLARGWIVGLVATTVAAVSHALAGGYRPGALSLGAALVFAGILGTFVIGRTPSLPRLSAAVGMSQLAFHLVFSLLGSGGAASVADDSGRDMPGMAGMAGMAVGPSPVVTMPIGGHDHLADPGMWIAHTVAAALTILFLRRAELALWTMLVGLGRLVVTRLTVVLVPVQTGRPRPVPVRPAEAGPLARVLVASVSRRGPPRPAF